MDDPVLHVRGEVLVGPHESRPELWVVAGRVTYTAPGAGVDVQTVAGYVLPGLVDAHCHLGLARHGAVDAETTEQQAFTDRDQGTLLVRDAGSPADTRWVQDRDDLPRLVRAGRHIARSRRYIRNYAHEVEPEDVVATVRGQARLGDGWVKLVGDWIDRDVGDLAPSWDAATLAAAVAAAHEEGARVTAHCFGEESLVHLAAAGIDSIEHATGLRDDTIAAFAAQGIAIVPTLINIDTFTEIAAQAEERFPTYAAHMRDLHRRRYETVTSAYEAGVPVYLGTDAGGTQPHGLQPAEAAEMVTAGLPTMAVLEAATWGARRWLRQDGLDEGASADLVVLREDPRADIRALGDRSAIVLRGRRVG